MKKILLMFALLLGGMLVSCNGQKTGPAVDDSIVEETIENTVVDTVATDSVVCDSTVADE